ncbi:CDP-diacylglycerol--glycerol-3-phosphate 3-phosphatidyltransferase [Peribacillus loiseleuriae]|uniref:CDP-diacylglycerol--glycerol-3-phosphate 3-phosphatidyltransferase n=1 Tax=Peribacillus loiseleuriae TaxID=1679170 RepID=A0A0K9GTD5_9BACI|nr:CDP-diacylglycerol--glycerol-3-phosphate 3-phosphatidyltransferase [Peribacillus loiseleuriae]KMY49517.1 CDP-diacylglycerol--glycerol-3-phosphate 3-phosphatidyltransferase [Peribacillus loiseleuriae]
MNLPNKITISRIILIPIFVILMLVPFSWGELMLGDYILPVNHLVGAILFILAASTDWVDGHYARKYNMVTNLGKFLDPLADKLLVSAALIVLIDLDLMYNQSWIAIVIISREFAVTGLRLVLAGTGEVVAADILGKIKMWAQIVAISALLLHNIPFVLISFPFANITLWIALVFTVWSGWDYFAKNKTVFINSK